MNYCGAPFPKKNLFFSFATILLIASNLPYPIVFLFFLSLLTLILFSFCMTHTTYTTSPPSTSSHPSRTAFIQIRFHHLEHFFVCLFFEKNLFFTFI